MYNKQTNSFIIFTVGKRTVIKEESLMYVVSVPDYLCFTETAG